MAVEFVRRAREPAIAVVIPSVPASDHTRTVACLEDQTLSAPYEVIVVDDADVDRSAARNRGLAVARADVVALTDDDTRPPPDWLAVARESFRAEPDLVCLEGPVFGGCRSVHPRHYVGCNLAVDREAALAVGGFRSAFSEWREDLEFGWRMEAEAAGTCRFDHSFRMCHPTVPRTRMKRDLERRLKAEYPERYADVLEDSRTQRLYRWGRAAGLTQPVHRLVNAVRFRFRDSCARSGRPE